MSQNLTWQQVPLIRILLPMLSGAIIYLFFPASFNVLSYLLIITIIIAFLLISFKKAWPYAFIILMLGLGYIHFEFRDNAYQLPSNIALDSMEYRGLIAINIQYDQENNRWKGFFTHFGSKACDIFKIYAWVERSKNFDELQKGDTLWVKSKLDTPAPPLIPGEFDFQSYLKRKNVAFISYINSSKVIKYAPKTSDRTWNSVQSWKQNQKTGLYHFTDSTTANLLNAILFGNSDQISNETRSKFTDTGIAHILAVSGMHVGILIMIIQVILKKIVSQGPYRRWISFISILILIWIYVGLCDFAASACRAALMASFYFLGKSLNIKASGLNAMAASGLVLFIIDPFYLLDLGTQLSFAAMAGILLSFSRIEYFFNRQFYLPNKLASLIAISFAAQLGVAPLIFYYFDHLPLVFWIFSIPAAYFAVILFAGGWLLVLLQNIWTTSAKYFGLLISKCGSGFLLLLDGNQYIPLPKLEFHYFPLTYVALAYLLVTLILIIMHSKSKRKMFYLLKSSLVLIVIWSFIFNYNKSCIHAFPIEQDELKSICIINQQKAIIVQSSKNKSELDKYMALKQAFPIDEIELKKISEDGFKKLFSAHKSMMTVP